MLCRKKTNSALKIKAMKNLKKKEVVRSLELQQLLCDLAYLDIENNPMFGFEYAEEIKRYNRCTFILGISELFKLSN